MKQSGEPVMSVNNSEPVLERVGYEWRPGELSMLPNEFCTCPKPLRTVLHICKSCMSRGRDTHSVYSDESIVMKDLLANWRVIERPFQSSPITQGKVAEKCSPVVSP